MSMKSYKELIVWQKSIILVKRIYILTENFPKTEVFGIAAQMRRSAPPIPSNIAEGYGRRSHKEYLQFLCDCLWISAGTGDSAGNFNRA